MKDSVEKVLALTGKDAEKIVREFIEEAKTEVECDTRVLPISVAAFMTPKLILENLGKEDSRDYDVVFTPGMMRGDLTKVGNVLGVRVFKGSRYASDFPLILENLDLEYSTERPADRLLLEFKVKKAMEIIESTNAKPLVPSHCNFMVGGLKVGLDYPPRIVAEVVDAPKSSNESILELVKYYLDGGAEIIDVGALAGLPDPERMGEIVGLIKDSFSVPVSVDTLDEGEILEGIDAGAELILSVDFGNLEVIDSISKDVALTVIPTNVKKGYMPKSAKERVENSLKLRDILYEKGFEKLLIDPLLESAVHPGLMNSLLGYHLFREVDPVTPMLMGVGNVVELADADSSGMNMLLAGIAVEENISCILTTEVSAKNTYSVNELVRGRNLAFVSNVKKAYPKDQGIDLLVAKSKLRGEPLDDISNIPQVKAKPVKGFKMDPFGVFRIWVNHIEKEILVVHYSTEGEKTKAFIGNSSQNLYREILNQGLVSEISHAAYLGSELSKAEACLKLGKTYMQDEPF